MSNSLQHILLLSLSLVTLVNCGGSDGESKFRALASTEQLEEAVLNDQQRSIATRICYAYQSKATSFRTSPYMGGSFKFNVRNVNCSNQMSEYTVTPVLRYDLNSALEFYLSDTSKLFSSAVQTDTAGFLSQLCTKIKNNEAIHNTVVNNDVRVQVEFFREDLDGYTLRYFVIGERGLYQFDSADSYKVRTQFNITNDQILGMDETFTRQKVCPGTSAPGTPAHSEFIQSFEKRVVPVP